MPDHARAASEEDLLGDPAPLPVVHYAEQALLGALLLVPDRLKTIGPLEPEHFSSAAHGSLFAAMRTVSPPTPEVHRTSPVWPNQLLDAAQTRALNAAYLHILISNCPTDAHAPAYAQMVRSGHARRLLRRHAGLLSQAARTPGPDPAGTVLARADELAVYLDELATAFPSHRGSMPRTPAASGPAAEASAEAEDEERMLLAAATARPDDLPRMRWLHESDFTVPVHAALFACLTALARRGAPVDPITLLWEAQQRGLLNLGFGPDRVLDLVSYPAGAPEHWGQKILQRALLSQAVTVASRIATLTSDEATSVHQLATGSRRALSTLFSVRNRWHHATNDPGVKPPSRPSAALQNPAVRAGSAARTPARPSR
ncbi:MULTISPECIES: DnaB-like helicase N-terminal domain-containing protein [Streptomyces]|uniref:DnaB-like helicase N-terminal domain-containing protein n=1 Tax=Streptomyces TaxID=1883 RepID=UPI0020795131|nr:MULTISPECIES: DnaB-like helicase N-terminal domain-containing protein [Streptomyces]MCM9083120.1 replicative DNA helicase [Streptomyces spororaveus]MCX4806992.1 replicative DNA helicase [Streptomyces sp. NBC_01214]MCX5274944.1 replicative DNA helicase [Streptomyces virginiae]WSQ01897.1 replicative DNA helicase [Streptomyces sp. NBC_01232]WSR13434.1 replicative DNA helicase [Streptomyces sp. NBC_01207]